MRNSRVRVKKANKQLPRYCINFIGHMEHYALFLFRFKLRVLALRLCMERIAPAPKDKSVSFPLPEMKDAMDASRAASSILTAVSEGELTPIEGTRVMGLIDGYRRTLELTEIEERLQILKNAH